MTMEPEPTKNRLWTPSGVVLLYVLYASLWIAVSDSVLGFIFRDPVLFARISTIKGLLFIAVTATLLYLLLARWHRSLTLALDTSNEYRQRLERVLKGSNDGWWDCDLKSNTIFYSSRSWEMLGYTPNELPADMGLWRLLVHPDDVAEVERDFREALSQGKESSAIEGRLRHKNGNYVPVLSRFMIQRNAAGEAVHVSGTNTDLTERKHAESRLQASETRIDFLAHHDPVTQLPNRVLLLSHLERGMRAAQRKNARLALLMLDLDRFKDINDSFGHAIGDELLRHAAQRLSMHLHELDTLARMGGDEFSVMLHIDQPEDAGVVANDIITGLNQPWRLSNGAEVHTGVSIGISIYPDHGSTTEELLQHADAALYQAKHEGRGCFRYFSQNLTLAARNRIELEARLHRALAQNELRVFYQPMVDIGSGRIIGAEALVRWKDPQEGLIPPARFIPIAESTGLINEIGTWVLRQACQQGRAWLDAGLPPLTLSVNLSPRQFQRGDVSESVAMIVAQTGFPATSLELELTETALMEPDAAMLLTRLRALGVRLAVDDFGTGYSSLAYLKHFPLDVLKVDKSFINDIPHHENAASIAAAIVAMGHSLGFKVLAEGVENEYQLAFLNTLKCDMYQGYLMSRPVPADEFQRLLLQTPATA